MTEPAAISVKSALPPGVGLVLLGHGSRDADGVAEFEQFAALLQTRLRGHAVAHGFLEFAKPTIDEAIRAVVAQGVQQMAVVPGVLLGAAHAKNDMPVEVLAAAREHPSVVMQYGAPLHLHPRLLDLCRERILQAEAASQKLVPRGESALVVVGRGTTDPDANSDVNKLARMLEEGLGFGASYVCYSGTARPLVADGLQRAARSGFKRLVVIPYFLFTGILVKRIYAATTDVAQAHPSVEILQAGYLGPDERVVDALLERATEALEGRAAMNCAMCKYRVQVIGYEQEQGAVQQGHHWHVRAGTEGGGASVKTAEPAKVEAGDLSGSGLRPWEAHPIEAESFSIIQKARDWSGFSAESLPILQRLAHTSGDVFCADEIYIAPGAVEAGLKAIARRVRIVTDVTMVQAGLRRTLVQHLGVETFCAVHDAEARQMAKAHGMTRSAAGVRIAWQRYRNDLVLAIGDAPTALEEALNLVEEQGWRPHLIVGLPVGFVGTEASKERLRKCLRVPRITNRGTRGGSPWAAAVLNALMITYARREAERVALRKEGARL